MAIDYARWFNVLVLCFAVAGCVSMGSSIARQVASGRAWLPVLSAVLVFVSLAVLGAGAVRGLRTGKRFPEPYLIGYLVVVACYLALQPFIH